jgi:hypothetical protein
VSFLLSLVFSLQQNQIQTGETAEGGLGREVDQTMDTCVSICKNDKIKKVKKGLLEV